MESLKDIPWELTVRDFKHHVAERVMTNPLDEAMQGVHHEVEHCNPLDGPDRMHRDMGPPLCRRGQVVAPTYECPEVIPAIVSPLIAVALASKAKVFRIVCWHAQVFEVKIKIPQYVPDEASMTFG